MKKIFIIAAAAFTLATTANAQQKTDKIYGPQKGAWSLSVGLNPVSDYLGNLFNGKTDNKLDNLNGEPVAYDEKNAPLTTISGKYMFSDKWGLKANIGMSFRNETARTYVKDDLAAMQDPFSNKKVIDEQKTKSSGASFALGAEYRLTSNKHRLQSYIDFGLVWAFETESMNYKYGNQITELNQVPTTGLQGTSQYVSSAIPYARKTSDNADKTMYHNFGVWGAIGIEYFVSRSISLGAEMNLSALYTYKGDHSTKYEGYNVHTQQVEEYVDVKEPSSSAFEFGTKNIGANISLTFYF